MTGNYGRDLDLNLLRVFAVVAENRSVTRAAAVLYLTQPAVSAALRRLSAAVGAPLFTRQGRGIALTERGELLYQSTLPHLRALVEGALSPQQFDPQTSDRTIRLGLSDTSESWLLPPLLRVLEKAAPNMRVIVLPVQFRTVAAALGSRAVDMAVTVADELPAAILRRPLVRGRFVCLYDPRHARFKKKLGEDDYFRHDHVIVSYNGDLRGVVEDSLRRSRRVRCSVSTFASIGEIVEGSALLATIPHLVAARIVEMRPHLRISPLPFSIPSGTMELLWPASSDDDAACRYVRDAIVTVTANVTRSRSR